MTVEEGAMKDQPIALNTQKCHRPNSATDQNVVENDPKTTETVRLNCGFSGVQEYQ